MWREIYTTMAALIVAPPGAWKALEKENRTHHEFLYRFLHPIFGIVAFASFAGGLWFVRDGNVERALKSSIVSIVGVYGGFFIASYILNEIAPRFGLDKNLPRFQQWVGYASAAIYLLFVITQFFPNIHILWALVLYTIYPVNSGAHFFMKVPRAKEVDFVVVSSSVIILAPLLVRAFFSYFLK